MARNTMQDRLAWGLNELAVATGLSLGLLRKQVRTGALRVTKVGRRNIVVLEDWHAFLALQANAGDPRRAAHKSRDRRANDIKKRWIKHLKKESSETSAEHSGSSSGASNRER